MRKRGNAAFYGDSGNNVDISQRHADGPGETDWASKAMKVLGGSPELANMPALKDEVMSKRLEDVLGDSNAGYDTAPHDDARLRQGYPEPDEYTEQAARIAKAIRRDNPNLTLWHDASQQREFVEGMARRLRGEPDPPRLVQPQEPEEKPFNQDEFFNNPEELQKAARQVRPRKL